MRVQDRHIIRCCNARIWLLLCSALLIPASAAGRTEYHLGGPDGNPWRAALGEENAGSYQVFDSEDQILRFLLNHTDPDIGWGIEERKAARRLGRPDQPEGSDSDESRRQTYPDVMLAVAQPILARSRRLRLRLVHTSSPDQIGCGSAAAAGARWPPQPGG